MSTGPQPGWTAPAPPKRPPYKRGWFWILVTLAVFGLLFAACLAAVGTAINDAATEAPTTAGGGISRGAGSKDATADVKLGRVTGPDAIGVRTIHLTITNHSAEPSDYYVELALEDADGNNLGSTVATADRIRPGQKAKARAIFTEKGVTKVTVTEVSRTASL